MSARETAIQAKHGDYFAALDGFRGILALCVAIYHTRWLSHTNSTAFFNQGTVIIDVFFVFSGFLMFNLYGSSLRTVEDSKTFIKRRFARIYPIHLFMLFVFLGFAVARLLAHKMGIAVHDVGEILPFQPGAAENWGSLLSNLTLTHAMGVHDGLTFNPPSWTISVEFFAYFTFAAMMLWARPTKAWHFGLIGVIIAAIYGYLASIKPNMDITYDVAFLRCLGGFYSGVVAAYAFQCLRARKATTRTATATSLEVVAAIGFVLFTIFCPGKLQFFVAPIAVFFVLVFAFDRGWVSTVMSHPILRYLGKISYSVYMVHVIIAIGFQIVGKVILARIFGEGWYNGWGGDVYLIPYLLVVIGFAHLTYHFIEVPGRRYINRMPVSRLMPFRRKSSPVKADL